MILHFAPLDLGLATLITLGTLHNQLVNNIDQNLTRRGPRTELGGCSAGGTVSSRAMRRVCTICIPRLSYTIPTEAVVAFRQHHGIDERAAADGTHEVVVVGTHIIDQTEVDGRVIVLFSRFAMLVVILFHPPPLLQTSYPAHLHRHTGSSGVFRRRCECCEIVDGAGGAVRMPALRVGSA